MADNKVVHEFEKEKLKWHDRYITVCDKYTARFGTSIVTEKFYARHDFLDEGAASQPNVLNYMDVVGKRQMSGPREIYDLPATENEVYGWLWDKAVKYEDDNDRELLYRCRVEHPLMKIQQCVAVGLMMDRYYKMLR